MSTIIIDDLKFDTETIDDVSPFNLRKSEYAIRCNTINGSYIRQAKEFENDDELYVNQFYFGITRNEETKRYKPSMSRLFYINIDGDDITIMKDIDAVKYKELINLIKQYVKEYC